MAAWRRADRSFRSWTVGKTARIVVLAAVITLIAVASLGMSNALAIPIARTASVHMPGLSDRAAATKIALLSDIHVGNIGMSPARLTEIVSRVNAERPDVILLAGDFIVGESANGAAERAAALTTPLSKLRARLGVFAVLGNHDHWTTPGLISAHLAKAGVIVLENEAVRRGPFAIVAVGDRFSGHDDLARSIAAADRVGGLPIIFTHSPDIAVELPDRFPLLLAGHTHCGQMVLPWLGPIIRYSRWRRLYNPRYRCGRIVEGKRTTFVTGGLGGTVPLRFNAVPDWWLISIEG